VRHFIIDARAKPAHDAEGAALACRFTDSDFKQPAFADASAGKPTLRRPYSLIGAGYAAVANCILRSLEGSGAPAGAGVCETP
jgi:hypothetical protein